MVMNRIDAIFKDLRTRSAQALMPFITAGDPDLAVTAALLKTMESAGAQICELGIPFSDPIADGPVIQASMAYALEHGTRPIDVLQMVAEHRSDLKMGLVAMVSYSIVHRLGKTSFIRDAKAAGIDGFLIPDLPLDESEVTRDRVRAEGLVCGMFVAPTTPQDRAERIARASSGFVYLLAQSGLTGERTAVPEYLPEQIRRLRTVTDLPIAVGFGISDRDQVRQVVSIADAAIVGSAIVRRVAGARDGGSDAVVSQVHDFVSDLIKGLPSSS